MYFYFPKWLFSGKLMGNITIVVFVKTRNVVVSVFLNLIHILIINVEHNCIGLQIGEVMSK